MRIPWHRVCVGTALAVLVAIPAFADEALSLDDAITEGLARHPLTAATAADIIAADAAARGARALPNPDITVAHGVIGPFGADEFLSISQPLDLVGARRLRARVADSGSTAARATAMMTRLELVRAITTAYWDAVLAQAARAQDDENVAHAEAMLAAATKQVELGHEPATHTMKAEVELARTRQQAIRTQAAVTQAKTALNAAMGRDPALPVVVPAALNFAPTTLDEVALLDMALARRPEIAVALADVEAARGGLALARLASRPDAAVQVRQERFGRGAAIGVAVALPLLDWGSARSGIQRTQATITASERRLEAVRAGVRFDVATALAALHSTDAQVRALQGPALMQAEKLAELAMTGYREGATNYLEVLEARRTLRAVKSEYLAALAEHRKALAQVAWATGADTPPVVKEVLP